MTFVAAYGAGFGVVLCYLIVCRVVSHRWSFWVLAEGQDGRLSTSKAQWLMWTIAVAFSYVAIYTMRSLHGNHDALSTVPQNVLLALGFSTFTMAGAKGITTAYVADGRVSKGGQSSDQSRVGDLLKDDSGATDLSKSQLLIWTLIAIGIFLANVVYQIGSIATNGANPGNDSLPDINQALLVLSGLAQGGYLGKKLVTSNRLQASTVLPASIRRADAVINGAFSVFGSGFGDPPPAAPPPPPPVVATAPPPAALAPTPDQSAVLANGFRAVIDSWSDGQIDFHLPGDLASLTPLAANPPPANGVTIAIKVVVSGGAPVDAGQVVVVA